MSGKLKILLVEPDVKKALKVLKELNSKSFYVSHLASLEHVLEIALKNSYHVVIMAASFQEGNTHNVVSKIRTYAPDISIITAVENSTPELEKKIRALGIAFFMGKPIQIEVLEQVLNRLAVVHRQSQTGQE